MSYEEFIYGKNYLRIKTRNPFRSKYLYIDARSYKADDIFARNHLMVKFKYDYDHPKYLEFAVVICTFPRFKESIFIKCMNELDNNLLLTGYSNSYPEVCKNIIGILIEEYKKERRGE